MALLHVDFFSDVLGMCTNMDVILPETTVGQIGMEGHGSDGKCPTLYLLHGMSDDHTIWQRRTSIERYASEYNLAVVMPTTHLGWYTDMDMGYDYWTFISKELPEICRRFFPQMSARREDTFAAGLSMGGYGAMKCGLLAPETFSCCASLSGELDIADTCEHGGLNEDGGYWDYCDFPLAEADDEIIANWPVPDPDDFDYDELLDRCKLYRHKAVHFGHPGVSDVMNNTGMIRGMENIYMDLALETESVMTLLDRRMKAELAMFERALDKCRDYVDFIWTGEDLGTQRAPLISLDMFRAQIRPRHQPLIDLASSYGKPVMIHCCGSSSWAFEDFIEMGIRAVDTLQPEAADMDPACLARKYGGRLAFHGCISTAKLAVMTPEAVVQNVAETLETMMPHHGYCLAPTHYLQDNTPVENVIAMYRTAHRLGRY